MNKFRPRHRKMQNILNRQSTKAHSRIDNLNSTIAILKLELLFKNFPHLGPDSSTGEFYKHLKK